MMLTAGLVACLISALAAFLVAFVVRRQASALGLVAAPNARSSHSQPTPSGGGLGIVAGGSVGGIFAAFQDRPELLFVVALSLFVAALGFVDDRRPVPVLVRLPLQIVLVGLMVVIVPSAPLMHSLGMQLPWLLLVFGLTALAVYWLNIFNFMDGIDGIAGMEAAFVLAGAALLAISNPGAVDAPHFWWALAVASACLGFLILNWPPARIFMGDVGSTYLGFVTAHIALVTILAGWVTPWQWLILVAMFLADATITLLRRLSRGEPIFRAHRLHAYQHLSRRWGGHRAVTMLYLAVNVVLLLPLAWWAGVHPPTAPFAAAAAYVAVIAGLVWAGAGAPEEASTRQVKTSS